MASEKTLALREIEQSLRPKREIKVAGPTMLESVHAGRVLSANRQARLRTEASQLTRKQRKELQQKRSERKMRGYEPPPPAWAAQAPRSVDVAELAEQIGQQTEETPLLDQAMRRKLTAGIVGGGTLCMSYAAYLELGGAPIEGGAPYGVQIQDGELTLLGPGDDEDEEQENEHGG